MRCLSVADAAEWLVYAEDAQIGHQVEPLTHQKLDRSAVVTKAIC